MAYAYLNMDGLNRYSAVNSEKTIFMKRTGDEYFIYGMFVDDMMQIYSCDALKDEFVALYKKDFEITQRVLIRIGRRNIARSC